MSSPDTLSAARERIATTCPCCDATRLEKSPAVLMPFIADRVFDWRPVEITAEWGLQTIPSGIAYPLCNSVYCQACDFLFLDIRFSDAELGRLYHDYRGSAYEALRDRYEPGYAERNRLLNDGVSFLDDVEAFIRPHLKGVPAVLDWGGDTGKNSPFKGSCSRLDIYEISDKPTIPGARRVTREEAQQQRYDLIVCSQVLEHVSWPADVIAEMRKCMGEDTLLYIELPMEELMKRELRSEALPLKRHWHEHVNFYSASAIEALVRRSGLILVSLVGADIEVANRRASHFRALCRLAR